MCKTIITHHIGCSPCNGVTHTTTNRVECAAVKIYRIKGIWFDCNPGSLTVWRDDMCSVCCKTPAKKLARVLKNPIHTWRFFGEKGVSIHCCKEATWGEPGCHNEWVIRKSGRKEAANSLWEMIQHIKIEIALVANAGAMDGRETPGEIIGRILT